MKIFEIYERETDVYKPNSFIIKEVEDTYATEILNNLFSNFNNTFSN